MNTIFIVTEANKCVATGHLMECIVCAEALLENGYEVSFWINDDAGKDLKKRIPCQLCEYHNSIEEDYELLVEEVYMTQPKVVIFNLREISERFLEVFKEKIQNRTTIICIDEFGHRQLGADIIVNPMIDSYYWDYGESKACLFCGAKYLILPKELELYHQKQKTVNKIIQKIVITMGGVDPKNYTLDLIEIVSRYFVSADINIVVGGGNQHYEDIIRKADRCIEIYHNKIIISQNILHSELLQMMHEADVVLCAGGNTLHEVACIGTPAIILPSMPHEKRTVESFVNKGFGLVINIGHSWKREISLCFEIIKSYQIRERMSANGKNISDGMGRKRVVKIINELVSLKN